MTAMVCQATGGPCQIQQHILSMPDMAGRPPVTERMLPASKQRRISAIRLGSFKSSWPMHISSSWISLTNARTFPVAPHRRSLAYRLQRAETAYGIVQPDAGAIRGRTAAISDREGWYFL